MVGVSDWQLAIGLWKTLGIQPKSLSNLSSSMYVWTVSRANWNQHVDHNIMHSNSNIAPNHSTIHPRTTPTNLFLLKSALFTQPSQATSSVEYHGEVLPTCFPNSLSSPTFRRFSPHEFTEFWLRGVLWTWVNSNNQSVHVLGSKNHGNHVQT